MERKNNYKKYEELMESNFIGPNQLSKVAKLLGIMDPFKIKKGIPSINYDQGFLAKIRNDYILILGMPYNLNNEPLTINHFRTFHGTDPEKKEPCMYNQDWYLKEDFSSKFTLSLDWYLVRKNVIEESRGKNPDSFFSELNNNQKLPSAILSVYTFFVYYYLTNGEMLWKNDYLWCDDYDHNGDRIFVGRYIDPEGMNNNGFSIHRHLKIRKNYCSINILRNKD
jgi:hypothetical protein